MLESRLAESLSGHEERLELSLTINAGDEPLRYGFRSFDRQWIIPDARVINQPNPALWKAYSPRQVYLTALEAHSPSSGPAITFTGLIPDLHHYKGSFGGRARPLWSDRNATHPNVKPQLLLDLAKAYGRKVKAEDFMAYIAALMAHPAFTERFAPDLVRPGLRVPVTADASLFTEAVKLGSEVIWLHCFGDRFSDPAQDRPKQAPRLPKESAPYIPSGGSIPSAPEPLPDTMDYDVTKRRLKVGKGYIEKMSRRKCGSTRFLAKRYSGTGSAIGVGTAPNPPWATNARLRPLTTSSRIIGCRSTRPTYLIC